jgi:hypothetical protein
MSKVIEIFIEILANFYNSTVTVFLLIISMILFVVSIFSIKLLESFISNLVATFVQVFIESGRIITEKFRNFHRKVPKPLRLWLPKPDDIEGTLDLVRESISDAPLNEPYLAVVKIVTFIANYLFTDILRKVKQSKIDFQVLLLVMADCEISKYRRVIKAYLYGKIGLLLALSNKKLISKD